MAPMNMRLALCCLLIAALCLGCVSAKRGQRVGSGMRRGSHKSTVVEEEWAWTNSPMQAAAPERTVERKREIAERQRAVKAAMAHAWAGYAACALGADDLRPLSCEGDNWLSVDTAPAVSVRFFDKSLRAGCLEEGLAGSACDALDTLLLMGMEEEAMQVVDVVEERLCFEKSNQVVDVFEAIIRVLGGLLSGSQQLAEAGEAADVLNASGKTRSEAVEVLERRARQLGAKMVRAFWSKTGLPTATVDLIKGSRTDEWHSNTKLAEVATNALEFLELSKRFEALSVFEEQAAQVFSILQAAVEQYGVPQMPVTLRSVTGEFEADNILSFGGGADSAFEYLLKTSLVLLKREGGGMSAELTARSGEKVRVTQLLHLYNTVVHEMLGKLVHTTKDGSPYVSDSSIKFRVFVEPGAKHMHHLTCFLPGLLGLGSAMGSPHAREDMEMAERLMQTCLSLYRSQATGLAAEVTSFAKGEEGQAVEAEFALRPEVLESLFVLHRLTGKEEYVDASWEIFLAIEKHCRVPRGYSGIADVTLVCEEGDERDECGEDVRYTDLMPSYFLAETLKYLYLSFSPFSLLSLDQFVFSTEAHPLRF